ncbi:hypothetical protein KR093_000630, partial [Drosophila rubida]
RNLRQIFEDDDKPLQAESSNLRYQPSQRTHTAITTATVHTSQNNHNHNNNSITTRTTADTAKPLEKWSTLVAKVANGYNGSESVGRVGVALSRNGLGAAKLVIYKSRSQLLSTLLLTKSTTSPVPRDGASQVILRASYMQFYDDDQRFWSLRFEATADEAEFTEALLSIGLPIEKMREDAQKKNQEQASTSAAAAAARQQALPQPLPRLKVPQLPAEGEDSSSCDSESGSTQSIEDNIRTSHRQALVPAAPATVTASSSSSGSVVSSQLLARNKLEAYLLEQRVNGQAMDKKMDTILQAMCRLTANSSAQLSEIESTARDPKPLSLAGSQLGGTEPNTDNEDELLELEQKLLDFKKQNRVLVKSLKQREQALAELRASTCALCEELLTQNNELKQQNSTLLTALATKVNATQTAGSLKSADNCQQCEKHLEKIGELEKRVQLLQTALIDYPKSLPSALASMNA